MQKVNCILCGCEASPQDFLRKCACPACRNALTQREVDNMYSLIEDEKK